MLKAEAALDIFSKRATHDFPPDGKIPPEWDPELEALAQDLGFPIRTASQMHERFREL
jgi:hypothetical protein